MLREFDRSRQEELISGNLSKHRGEVKKMAQEYKCNACGKTFNSEKELQEHAKTCK
jgi:transposase-like protein